MNLKDKIIIYIKEPSIIKNSIKEWWRNRVYRKMKSYRDKYYKYEDEKYYKTPSPYMNKFDQYLNCSIFNPVVTVIRVLEQYFSDSGFKTLMIGGIDVDTQKEAIITVTIKLQSPGLLIGKAGDRINAIATTLSDKFNKKTVIEIKEIKNDINRTVFNWNYECYCKYGKFKRTIKQKYCNIFFFKKGWNDTASKSHQMAT